MLIKTLSTESLPDAAAYLADRDEDMADLLSRYGIPPLWGRAPGFATLVHIILEQQVSLASAKAAFKKLERSVREITPANVLALDDQAMRSVGFSRQKMQYVRNLGEAVQSGILRLEDLSDLEDEAVRRKLTAIKGVGKWTADIYLLMALKRPDVWPEGDLALAEAVKSLNGLGERPSSDQLIGIAEPWRPYRAVAARILWNYYLLCLRPPSGTT